MEAALEILMSVGLPYGPARPRPRDGFDDGAVAEAVARLAIEAIGEGGREALLAWLSAFEHHWPARFEAVLGPAGAALLQSLRARIQDPNRYLKLRRIATANLAGLL